MTNASAVTNEEGLLQNLVLDEEFESLEDLLAEFNLFDVLGIAKRELQHSAFLAWLLDSRGSHGLRDYFLRHFLSQAAAEDKDRGTGDFTPFDVDGWKLDNVEIEVTTERHNIDILLVDRADEFVCLVENKIGASEHDDQLSRYLRIVRSEYQGLIPFPIFLTPEGVEPSAELDAEHWIPLGYGRVADLIERVSRTRGSNIGTDIVSFLKQYEGNLRRYVLNTTGNIDELALKLYDNHRAAIDLIINAKAARDTAGRETVWGVLDTCVESQVPDLRRDVDGQGIHRFYSGSLEGIESLRMGEGWTRTGRMVLFEFKHTGGLELFLYLGPGPAETRLLLYDLVQRGEVEGVGMRTTNRLPQKWHCIYKKRILNKADYNPFDPEAAGPKAERPVREFYHKEYWPIVNAIRKGFGLEPVSPEIQTD